MTGWRSVGTFMSIVLGIGFGLDLLAWIELALGWIGIDRCIGMLADGATILAGGIAAVPVWVAWSRLRSYWIRRRIRRNLLSSLGGYPPPVAEGRTGPVDSAGSPYPARPDSSTVSHLELYRSGPWRRH